MALTSIEKQQIGNNARLVHSKLYAGVPTSEIAGQQFTTSEEQDKAVIGSLVSHYYDVTPFQGYGMVDHLMENLWPDSTYKDVVNSFRETKSLPNNFPRKSQLIEVQKALDAQRIVASKYQSELSAIRDKVATANWGYSQQEIDKEAMMQFKRQYRDLDQSVKDELSLGNIKPFEKTTLGVSMYDMVEAGLSKKSMADYVAKSSAQIEKKQSEFLQSIEWQKEAQAISQLPWYKEKYEKSTRAFAQSMLSIGSATMRGAAVASGNQWEYAQNISRAMYNAQSDPGLAFDREDLMDWGITIAYQVLPIMGIGVASSVVNPVLGTSFIGLMEYNDTYWTLKNNGESEEKANAIGLAVGIINGAIEQASGGGSKYLKLAEKASKRLSNSPRLIKALSMGVKPAELLETAVHEGLEEMGQGAVSMAFTNTAPRKKDGSIDMQALSADLAEQGVLGMVGSVAMSGISSSAVSVFGKKNPSFQEMARASEEARIITDQEIIQNAEQISNNKIRINVDSKEMADTIINHYANKADMQGYGIKADIDLANGTLDIEVIEDVETIKAEKPVAEAPATPTEIIIDQDIVQNVEQVSDTKLRINVDSEEAATTVIDYYANKAAEQGYNVKSDYQPDTGTLYIEFLEGAETAKPGVVAAKIPIKLTGAVQEPEVAVAPDITAPQAEMQAGANVVQDTPSLTDDYTPADVNAKEVLSRPEMTIDQVADKAIGEVDAEVEADDVNSIPADSEQASEMSIEEQRGLLIEQMANLHNDLVNREKDLWPDKPRVYQGKDIIEDLDFKNDPTKAFDYLRERIAEFGNNIDSYSLQEAKERWEEIKRIGKVFNIKVASWSTFAKSRGRTKFTKLGNGEYLNTTIGALLQIKYDDLAISQIMAQGDKQFKLNELSKVIAGEINSKTDYESKATEEIDSWENAVFSEDVAEEETKPKKQKQGKKRERSKRVKPINASVLAKRYINKHFPNSNKALKNKLLRLVESNTLSDIETAIKTTLAERDRFDYKKYRKKVQKLLPIVRRAMKSTGRKGMDDKIYNSLKTFLDTFSYDVPDALNAEMLNVLIDSVSDYLDTTGITLPEGFDLRETLAKPEAHAKEIEVLKEWVSPQIMQQLENYQSKLQAFESSSPALMKYAYELLRNAVSVNSEIKRQASMLFQANVEKDIHAALRDIEKLKDRRNGVVGDDKTRSLWSYLHKLGITNEKFDDTLAYQLSGARRNTVLMRLLHTSRLEVDDMIIKLTNDLSENMRAKIEELGLSFDDIQSISDALDFLPKDLKKLGVKIDAVKPKLLEFEVMVDGKLLQDGKLPAGKLINLYMLLRQEDSRIDIRKKGIALNQDVVARKMSYDEVQAVNELVEGNETFMKFVELIDYMYEQQYRLNNQTHQSLYQGTRLPRVENYVPIGRLGYMGVGAKRNVVPTPAEYFRQIQERTGGGNPILLEDAFANVIHNMVDSIVVASTAEIGRHVKGVFGDDVRIQEELKRKGYAEESEAINALVNMLAGQKIRGNDFDSILNKITRGLVRSTLSSFGVIGGQVFSYVGYFSYTSNKYMTLINYKPKHEDVRRARQICPILHISFMGFGMDTAIDNRLSPSALRGWVGEDKALVDYALKPISIVDAYTKYQAFLIAEAEMRDPELSGVALAWYNQNGFNPLALEYDSAEYRDVLNKRTRFLINATQPTSGFASQVANSELAGDAMGGLLMFRSYVRKPLNMLMQAMINHENGNIDKSIKPLGSVIANVMMSFTMYSIFRHLLDLMMGKDKDAKDLLASILTAPVNLIPVIGYPTKQAVSKMFTGKYAPADIESISLAFVGDVTSNFQSYFQAAHYMFSDETMASGPDRGKQKRAVYLGRAMQDTLINTMKFYGVPRNIVDVPASARYKKAEPVAKPKKTVTYQPRRTSSGTKERKYIPPMR